jgi:hypothetical protein
MLGNTNSSQAVKRARNKYQSLAQLHSRFVSAAAAKQPALAGHVAGSSSSSGSPFAADIGHQLAESAARSNQKQAFDALQAYFSGLSEQRPSAAQLAAALQRTYDAMCQLRQGVCALLLSSNTVSIEAGSAYYVA